MKTLNIKYHLIILLVLSVVLTNCKKTAEIDDAPAPDKVTNLSYEKTNGGAIINYTAPEDKNLLYVEAVYINSQNREVSKVSSRYSSSIEIDGFMDLEEHIISLYSVGNNGKKSEPATISIIPDTSFIFIVQENIKVNEILGGIEIRWDNPTRKMIYLDVQVSDGAITQQHFFSSEQASGNAKIRDLDTIPYSVKVAVEDFNNNKTSFVESGPFTPLPEIKINKDNWSLIADKSCMGDKYEGLMINFWDDVIDRNDNPNDNSYFIIHREDNGGQLNFISPAMSPTNPLMIVIDLKQEIVLSRLAVWQRAFRYRSSDDGGMSEDHAYYLDDNMRSFNIYGSNNLTDITPENLRDNPLMICDIGEGRDEEGNFLPGKLEEAENGHTFELKDISHPFRYLTIGITGTYGSETQICSSEITLWGLVIDETP